MMPATKSSCPLPAELSTEQVVAVIDSREQTPLDLSPLRMETGTLATADYSVKGMTDRIAIERKSLPDYLACIGGERERFERELMRLRAYETRAVVIEADWSHIEAGGWRSSVTPAAVIGSTLSWLASGIPFLFVGNHAAAGRTVSRLLFLAARQRYRELRELTRFCLSTEVGE
jgi:DNA excision repair protein ERCC-4